MIISRTPFRVSFFGGGTDYPAWYRKHGGAVLASTIDKYCYITCRYLPPFFEHRFRVVWSKIESCQTVDEINHPAVRTILHFLKVQRGVEIHHDGDLPARSGIGSSSSFTVGLLNALHALKGQMPSKQQLAEEGIYIEQECLKEAVGEQDQVLAAYGGFNHVTFHPHNGISITPVTLPSTRIKELNSHLMLFYTGIARTSSQLAQGYAHRVKNNTRRLNFMKDLVEEALSLLSGRGDLLAFGRLLGEAWKAKRSLSLRISNSEVDQIYETALTHGAIGGKLTGAGGGGFMLLFASPSKQRKIKEKLHKLIHVPFKFESSGSQIIFADPEADYSNEDKVRRNQKIRPFRELGLIQNFGVGKRSPMRKFARE